MNKAKKIELVSLDAIKPHPKNPTKHSKEQIRILAKVIKANGFRVPVIISTLSGYLVCGHGRIQAARLAGMSEVPVIYQDFDSEAQEYQVLVADNGIAAWADMDLGMISDVVGGFEEFDFELLGLEGLLPKLEAVIEPSPGPEPKPELKVACPGCGEVFNPKGHLAQDLSS